MGYRCWEAFAAPDPTGLEALRARDLSPLPFVGAALKRMLEQYPAVGDGLSRTERQILESVAGGAQELAVVFRHTQDECEECPFMGDTTFLFHVRGISEGDRALVRFQGDGDGSARGDWHRQLELTADGRAVLRGSEDRVALLGLDRWLGGVRLQGQPAWRWNRETQRLVAGPVS